MENLLKKFNWIAHSSNVFYSNEKIFVFNKEMQNYLIDLISKSECEIARICAHNNHKDRLHEMVIVLKDSHYVAPHKHINKSESFHIIEGIVRIGFLDNKQKVENIIQLDKDKYPFYRMNAELWHIVVPISELVVIHEVTNGPFIKGASSIFPEWYTSKRGSEIANEIRSEIKLWDSI